MATKIKMCSRQEEIEIVQWSIIVTGPQSIVVWYEAVIDGRNIRCAGKYENPWRDDNDQTTVHEIVIVDGQVVSGHQPWDSADVEENVNYPINAENIAWALAEHCYLLGVGGLP